MCRSLAEELAGGISESKDLTSFLEQKISYLCTRCGCPAEGLNGEKDTQLQQGTKKGTEKVKMTNGEYTEAGCNCNQHSHRVKARL